MKILELFAGSRSIGNVADELGYDVFSVDINNFAGIDLVQDIEFLNAVEPIQLETPVTEKTEGGITYRIPRAGGRVVIMGISSAWASNSRTSIAAIVGRQWVP